MLSACVVRPEPTTGPGPGPGQPPATGNSGVSNSITSPIDLACENSNAAQGTEGTSWYMRCPACNTSAPRLWGSDIYAGDSNVCAAAVHAGAIRADGGVFLVTWVGHQWTYIGSSRNGINSADYGQWGRSFYVQSVDTTGAPTSPAVSMLPANTVRMSCAMPAVWIKAPTVRVLCPPGCTKGGLWGTDVYHPDSQVCVAAVHAGLSTVERGGEVTLTFGPNGNAFRGTTRNGVTSTDYPKSDSGFQLSR